MKTFRDRNGFTLVELLVVIGIIAVLISILLPVLHRARQAAQAAVCMSNLRQWGMALEAYVDQYKGMLPQKGPDGHDSAQAFGPITNGNNVVGFDDTSLWFNALPPYINQTPYSQMVVSYLTQGGLLPHVNGDTSLWICPSAISPTARPGSNDTLWSGGSGFPSDPENDYFELFGMASTTSIFVGGKVTLSEFPFYSTYCFNSKMTTTNNEGVSTTVNLINMSKLQPGDEVVTMAEKISYAGEDTDSVVQQWYSQAPAYVQLNSKIDSLGYTSNIAQPKCDWTRFTTRHTHGGHLLFADGHVQWFAWPEVQISPQQEQLAGDGGQNVADWNQYGKIVWGALGPVQ
jgi:prepilin-type N-terminal cleavage/methylation domain-containing protein/prepilin-type processing-associated H-X9-DG protein